MMFILKTDPGFRILFANFPDSFSGPIPKLKMESLEMVILTVLAGPQTHLTVADHLSNSYRQFGSFDCVASYHGIWGGKGTWLPV